MSSSPVGLRVVGPAEQLQFAGAGTEPLDDAVYLVWFVRGGAYLGHQYISVQAAVQKLRLPLHPDQAVLLQKTKQER